MSSQPTNTELEKQIISLKKEKIDAMKFTLNFFLAMYVMLTGLTSYLVINFHTKKIKSEYEIAKLEYEKIHNSLDDTLGSTKQLISDIKLQREELHEEITALKKLYDESNVSSSELKSLYNSINAIFSNHHGVKLSKEDYDIILKLNYGSIDYRDSLDMARALGALHLEDYNKAIPYFKSLSEKYDKDPIFLVANSNVQCMRAKNDLIQIKKLNDQNRKKTKLDGVRYVLENYALPDIKLALEIEEDNTIAQSVMGHYHYVVAETYKGSDNNAFKNHLEQAKKYFYTAVQLDSNNTKAIRNRDEINSLIEESKQK